MKPIIIIGAARSGTNMLRDIINSIPTICTWNCDEINPIWKHKNTKYKYDDLTTNDASPNVKKFIRKKFENISTRYKSEHVLEKTCANSLRIPFVNSILPESKYIVLFRNGYDASISANIRWHSSFDLIYSIKKIRYVPLADIFFYLWQFGKLRIEQFFKKDKSMSVWGPNTHDIETFSKNKSLLKTSAYQWSISVNKTIDALQKINKDNYIVIQYERFVNNPIAETSRILNFLKIDIDTNNDLIATITAKVNNRSVDKYKKVLNEKEIKEIAPIIEPTMKKIDEVFN